MFHSMRKANILAKFSINFPVDTFVDDTVNSHIFDDIFKGNIKRNHILKILEDLTLSFI